MTSSSSTSGGSSRRSSLERSAKEEAKEDKSEYSDGYETTKSQSKASEASKSNTKTSVKSGSETSRKNSVASSRKESTEADDYKQELSSDKGTDSARKRGSEGRSGSDASSKNSTANSGKSTASRKMSNASEISVTEGDTAKRDKTDSSRALNSARANAKNDISESSPNPAADGNKGPQAASIVEDTPITINTREELDELISKNDELRMQLMEIEKKKMSTMLSARSRKNKGGTVWNFTEKQSSTAFQLKLRREFIRRDLRMERIELTELRDELQRKLMLNKRLQSYYALIQECKNDISSLSEERRTLMQAIRSNEKLLITNSEERDIERASRKLADEIRADAVLAQRALMIGRRDASDAIRMRKEVQQRVEDLSRKLAEAKSCVLPRDATGELQQLYKEYERKTERLQEVRMQWRQIKNHPNGLWMNSPPKGRLAPSEAESQAYYISKINEVKEEIRRLSAKVRTLPSQGGTAAPLKTPRSLQSNDPLRRLKGDQDAQHKTEKDGHNDDSSKLTLASVVLRENVGKITTPKGIEGKTSDAVSSPRADAVCEAESRASRSDRLSEQKCDEDDNYISENEKKSHMSSQELDTEVSPCTTGADASPPAHGDDATQQPSFSENDNSCVRDNSFLEKNGIEGREETANTEPRKATPPADDSASASHNSDNENAKTGYTSEAYDEDHTEGDEPRANVEDSGAASSTRGSDAGRELAGSETRSDNGGSEEEQYEDDADADTEASKTDVEDGAAAKEDDGPGWL
ncbi:hypothetical protein ERJ75_001828900 [Trypanosoma vivax]|uniref:DUF4201 domain-containing protein n=1 Tax=Trypanosoma vivax (strain Y486) TaxID=1055687 RepID=G0U927_TRYVY|nr:hypothetical protein ERJ75_001828900 [Trypanosoma vivax]CCC54110.1 conserved hypothetical protein [Trypanosoma vivax Y486]